MMIEIGRTESEVGQAGVTWPARAGQLDGKAEACERGSRSSGGAMVEVEQSTQPLGFAQDACTATRSLIGERDDIIESLVIAFVPMVGQILLERVAQGTFAEENQMIETFLLHGTDPPFGESVEIG